jgi:hypothetical protein
LEPQCDLHLYEPETASRALRQEWASGEKLPPARQEIDRIGDSFELGCESPRFVWRKHRVRAVEIDMHLVIKSKDCPSGDERDARFRRHIVGSPKDGRI